MLISEDGPESCVLGCEGSDWEAVEISPTSAAPAVLSGIRFCRSAASIGNVIGTWSGYVLIQNCQIVSNLAGAIESWGNDKTWIRRCLISDNVMSSDSWAFGVVDGENLVIENSLIVRNLRSAASEFPWPEAVVWLEGSGEIVNCTIADNELGGLDGYGGLVRNTIIWSNTGFQISDWGWIQVSYSCIQGGWEGEGNLANNPRFAAGYCLRADSPCIDAGTLSNAPTVDMRGVARWDHPGHTNIVSAADIGAFEFVDSDSDDMDDKWEERHGIDAPEADEDGDGLQNRDEYDHGCSPVDCDTDDDGLSDHDELFASGTDPVAYDTDGDHIPDGWEFAHGLDPLDSADGMTDPDGDQWGNAYEWFYNTDPADDQDVPSALLVHVEANAPEGGDGSPEHPYARIQSALDNAPSYSVVLVGDGLYQGPGNRNLVVPARPLIVRSESGAAGCTIDCEFSGPGVTFACGSDERTVFHGFTIRRASGGAIRCIEGASPIIEYCLLKENTATGAPALAVECAVGASPIIRNCTLSGNRGIAGGVFWSSTAGKRHPVIENCIVWSNLPAEIAGSVSTVRYCCLESAYPGEGNITNDPRLVPGSCRLQSGSPCIDAATNSQLIRSDLDGEGLWDAPLHSNAVSIADVGADEFVDCDGDQMADGWELLCFGGTGRDGIADADTDGLNDREEYEYGTDPNDVDTDDDGVTDGEEVHSTRTSPVLADSDADGMDDYWELMYSLEPLTNDAYLDPDRDGFDSLEEYQSQPSTDPQDPWSTPSAVLYVATNGTSSADGSYTNPLGSLAAAVALATDGVRVVVFPGVYAGESNRNIQFAGKRVTVKALEGPFRTIIDCEGEGRALEFRAQESNDTVVCGFTIVNGSAEYGGAIYCGAGASPTIIRCVLVSNQAAELGSALYCDAEARPLLADCVIADNTGGEAAVWGFYDARPILRNCTISYNHGIGVGGLYMMPELINCIVWSNTAGAVDCLAYREDHSCIESQWHSSPLMARHRYYLHPEATCIDSGSESCFSPVDIQNEPRWDAPGRGRAGVLVDIGADEFVDSDSDGLADSWERDVFGGLSRNGQGDFDADGLDDRAEYLYGTDPTESDTDGDGISDGDEIHTYHTDPLNGDTDGDGLPDGYEVSESSLNPLSFDSDEDGLSDSEEVSRGLDPGNSDTDGDGLQDGEEEDLGADPSAWDTDGDGLSDGVEAALLLSPNDVDTDDDGISDADEDSDGDGYSNLYEQDHGYDPMLSSSNPVQGSGESIWADGSASYYIPTVTKTCDGVVRTYEWWRYDARDCSGWAIQDWRRDTKIQFANIFDSIPAYIYIEHLPGNNHQYSVSGASLAGTMGDVRIYACMPQPGTSPQVHIVEHMVQVGTSTNGRPLYDFPAITISQPQPLYVNVASYGRIAPKKKENVGLIIGLNCDDDDSDGEPDWRDDYVPGGDDDLVKVTLARPFRMPVSIDYDSTIIRLYENPSKKLRDRQSGQWVYSARVGACIRNSPYKGYDDQIVYVEGIHPGTTYLTITGMGGFSDRLKISVINPRLVPDWNHNRIIGPEDEARTEAGKPFRFWVNDDDDEGDLARGNSDLPGHMSGGMWPADWSNGRVDGRSDLEDFFPVWLDLHQTLQVLAASQNAMVRLKQNAGAVAMVYTDLRRDMAGEYLTRDLDTFGRDGNEASYEARTYLVDAQGIILPPGFLDRIRNDEDKGIVLFEGRMSTSSPLELEIWEDGRLICRRELPLRTSGVEEMFWRVNLREVLDGGGANIEPASNVPEGDLLSGKVLMFVHGFRVGEKGARMWWSEMFKRFYWSGSRARFYGVTWKGNEGAEWWNLWRTLDYHVNVKNALDTAPYLAGVINGLGQEVVLVGHSLGSMLGLEAVAHCGAQVDKMMALNGAVALEAFDGSEATVNSNMWWTDWDPYERWLWCSEWHTNFAVGDGRRELTWRNWFSNTLDRVWNIYSSGDEVLEMHPHNDPPGLLDYFEGRHAWCLQEKRKGRNWKTGIGGTTYGGWGFSSYWDKKGRLPTGAYEVVRHPFFRPGEGDLEDLYVPDDAGQPDMGSGFAWTNLHRLVAGFVPALSLPLGANKAEKLDDAHNIDMQGYVDVNWWPEVRLRSRKRWKRDRWRGRWLRWRMTRRAITCRPGLTRPGNWAFRATGGW